MNTKGSGWFWLAIVVILGGAWWYQSYTPSNNIQWVRDFDAARQTAETMDRPMLLYFTADWCGPCKQMHRNVWPKQDVERLVNGQTVPVYLDIDDPAVEPIAMRYQVNAIPTLVLTDAAGHIIPTPSGMPATIVGYADADAMAALIDRAPPPAAGDASVNLEQ